MERIEGGENEVTITRKKRRRWAEKVDSFDSPEDFLQLFAEIGIPGDKWKSCAWLQRTSKLPVDQGGLGECLVGLENALCRRFKGFPGFIAWMKGRDVPENTWAEKVKNSTTTEDFLRIFREIGIPDNKWRNCEWLESKAKLPKEQGGIGYTLTGLSAVIRSKFGGHPQFVAWMDGKEKPDNNWIEKVNSCLIPSDFLKLFQETGIPGEKWKSCGWLLKKSRLPIGEGGIGRSLSGLYVSIRKRFGGHPQFVAWMEGRTVEPKLKIEIPKIKTPEDAIEVIREQALALGITEDGLLNPEKISEYIRSNPAIKAALKFLK